MSSFNSARGADSRNSDDTRHLSDPTRVFFARYLIRRRENCGIAAVIRVAANTRKVQTFRIVAANTGQAVGRARWHFAARSAAAVVLIIHLC